MNTESDELASIRREVDSLRAEIASLRAAAAPDAEVKPPHRPVVSRRGVLGGVAVGAVAAAAGLVHPVAHARAADVGSGDPLSTRETYEAPLDVWGNDPALDSPVVWKRHHTQSHGGTDQILSLIHEADGPQQSFPWPLYIQLTSRAAEQGEGTGAYVRLFNEKANWGASYHTDLFALSSGPSLGVNVELKRNDDPTNPTWQGFHFDELPKQPTGRAIGVNIHNDKATSNTNGDQALNIQGETPNASWDTGVNIEDTNQGTDGVYIGGDWKQPLHIRGTGGSAIRVEGRYDKGLELKHNDIHLSSGAKLYLDDAGTVFLRYNRHRRCVEIVGPRGVRHSFAAD